MSNKSRHKDFTPNSWETVGDNKLSTALYMKMLTSEAYLTLSSNATRLYTYMKLQLYGQHGKDKIQDPENKGRDCFVFNKAMWSKDTDNPHSYRLFGNGKQFKQYKSELIEHGFIDEVQSNWTTREKNIYCFSSRWKTWQSKDAQNIPP